jgi:NO-binding membrane sensor protein with MHYT domain
MSLRKRLWPVITITAVSSIFIGGGIAELHHIAMESMRCQGTGHKIERACLRYE